jgi:Domain of unknown function (DUF4403)
MKTYSNFQTRHRRRIALRSACAGLAALGSLCIETSAFAADKPALNPDTVAPFTTDSRISATVEFSLRSLASQLSADIPQRLASINEQVNCVHRRVLFINVNANCDLWGFVERSGPVSLYGRDGRVYGSVPIYGAIEGQGANRFTARIHGDTEARATIEVAARPELTRDWTIDLNFSDGFHWNEAPVLHVLGRDIPLAKYAEPRMSAELARVRGEALAAARKMDLRSKAEAAWRHAFEPIQLSQSPSIWLQVTPTAAAFAGVRADATVLSGSLELSGSAQTIVGDQAPSVTATPLPALGRDVAQPGSFDLILPVRIGYDVLKNRIAEEIAELPQVPGLSVRDVDVYPSSGKLVIGFRIAKDTDTGADAGRWVYLAGGLQVDQNGRAVRLSDLNVTTDNEGLAPVIQPIMAQLRDKMSVDYGVAYQNLLNAVNVKLTRPLKDGFRMEGHADSAALQQLYLPDNGITIAMRATGALKILYGM